MNSTNNNAIDKKLRLAVHILLNNLAEWHKEHLEEAVEVAAADLLRFTAMEDPEEAANMVKACLYVLFLHGVTAEALNPGYHALKRQIQDQVEGKKYDA